jgi:hypothetical protein
MSRAAKTQTLYGSLYWKAKSRAAKLLCFILIVKTQPF